MDSTFLTKTVLYIPFAEPGIVLVNESVKESFDSESFVAKKGA